MTKNPKITPEHLGREAIVYVRQSSPTQLVKNTESRRRQYDLADAAKKLGFQTVETIDDDLGVTASGQKERPGFERLFSEVASGRVGAVFCIEASRLARNGRDWHTLIDICGLVGALVVDPEGVYDPRLSNDRLLLGLKGSLAEYELTLFRQRSLEATRRKARRGELMFLLPAGLYWTQAGKVELTPDRRVQEAIRTVFLKFAELGSARQVLLWFLEEDLSLPIALGGPCDSEVRWKRPVYSTVLGVLKTPFHAGAYAHGQTESRSLRVGDRERTTRGHRKSMERWNVLIRDHHPGYITWQEYERNQQVLSENFCGKMPMSKRAGRGGRSLLAGVMRCRRCSRMLSVSYGGARGDLPTYSCDGRLGEQRGCFMFGGKRVDHAVSKEVLRVVEDKAIEAAIEAAERRAQEGSERLRALSLELEQAQYEARLARRRYEAVDPDNRLVAGELEARWNGMLEKVCELERHLVEKRETPQAALPNRESLLALASDLPAVWESASTDMRVKQRIVRILLEEIIADVDSERCEIVLVLHWVGGRHSELRVRKNKPGDHSRRTADDTVDIVRRMAGRWSDQEIAASLNRLNRKTGAGNNWNAARVRSLRSKRKMPPYDPSLRDTGRTITQEMAAAQLGVSRKTVHRFIKEGLLPGSQVAPGAPWEIPRSALQSKALLDAASAVRTKSRKRATGPCSSLDASEIPMFPEV